MKDDLKKQNRKEQAVERGQSLVEYALILVLVALAFGVALAATGPAISNVFSNTVYNLLGQAPGDVRQAARPGDFWLTVTWVAENPLQERPLPTRTLAPPSATPTDGPSPTYTPITPTNTPRPTSTPRPSPTPSDIEHIAPFHDSADVTTVDWYRLGDPPFLGYGDWLGEYYVGQQLDYGGADPTAIEYNRNLYGPAANRILDFPNSEFDTWQSGGSGPLPNWPAGSAYDNFSIRFTRDIFLDREMKLSFFISSDDGVRLWLLAPGQSANDCFSVANGGDGTVSGGPRVSGDDNFYGDNSAYPTGCLLIDDWENQGSNSTGNVVRTIQPGTYTLQVDYYESGGGSALKLEIGADSNPDDTTIAGDPPNFTRLNTGADCNWGRRDGDDANTLEYMWEEYRSGDIPNNTLCYLELRGWVYIPAAGDPDYTPIQEPQFVYWDVWDFQRSSQQGWLEIAEYVPQSGVPNAVNREALQWYRYPLRSGGTANYNWTRNVIDLQNFLGLNPDGTAMASPIDWTGKNVTFRFAMANGDDGGTRRWYLDDIQIIDRATTDFSDQVIGLNTEYLLNDPEEEKLFIASGQWALTANNALYDGVDPVANPSGCCSWELNPGRNYTEFSESPWDPAPNSQIIVQDMRVHYVQLQPMISRTLSLVDQEGDEGDPMLSFWTGYDIDRYVGLEVQYRAIGSNEWRVVPGPDPDNPYGRIVSPANTDRNTYRDKEALQPIDISLEYIRDAGGNPIEYYQLRFAMLVHRRADMRDGWWIDNIKLHREGKPRYVDYPFRDNAEIGMDNWLATGGWWRTTEAAWDGQHAFHDSPGGNYQTNTGSSLSGQHLRIAHPIDFNNDTPDNLLLFDRNPAGGNTFGTYAQDPVLSFWWRRELNRQDNFHVEWRRVNEDDTEWKPLWSFLYNSGFDAGDGGDNHNDTDDNFAWEYVQVDLTPIMNTFLSPNEAGYDPSDFEADDIYFRFRLYSDGRDTDNGVYVDEVRIEERQQPVFRLWPISENRSVGGQNFGTGDGANFGSDADEPDWFETWRLWGNWERITWEQHNGLHAFHESGAEQTVAPFWNGDDNNVTKTIEESMHVLELTPIFDLRATDLDILPTLYFWSRYHTGAQNRLRVQISYELEPGQDYLGTLEQEMENRCGTGRYQCYHEQYGWSPWYNAPFFRVNGNERTWTWQQFQIDLSTISGVDLAANYNTDTPGRRIRIRFLFDAYRNRADRMEDGWYIDNVLIAPRRDDVKVRIANNPFADDASNLTNWIAEGYWGLSPEVSLSGDTVISQFGVWNEYWWDCGGNNCNVTGGGFLQDVDEFLDNHADPADAVQRLVGDISYDLRRGAPRPGVFDARDYFAGRWVLETLPIGSGSGIREGTYTLITTSDDGVRMKAEEIDANGNVIDTLGSPSAPWNIINNWTYHGRITDMGTVTLETGKRYRFTLEYFEASGDAVIILSIGGATFSLTDSPKQGTGPSFPDQPAAPFGNSSLILNGTLDMAGVSQGILQISTVYELGCGTRAVVEVSNDGGFTWQNNTLDDDMVISTNPLVIDTDFDSANFEGVHDPLEPDWEVRRYNLSAFENQLIMLRFRLNRQNDSDLTSDSGCRSNLDGNNPNGYYISWWLGEITVAQ
ncbi:MAG: PA14 domain-containing protein [Chloroflexota bacterium]